MLTIRKKKKDGKFYYWVTAPTTNGRILSNSETFTVKLNAVKNIKAQLKMFGGKSVDVLDETIETPEVISISQSSVKKKLIKKRKV